MAKLILTNKAVTDLNVIWDYTAEKWSEEQADPYYRELMEFCQWITKNPILGENYETISSNLFGFKKNKPIIFFWTLKADVIEITRILHERMDLRNRL